MIRYLKYLWYVIRHKYYVGAECFRHGLYWQGITHDWSKFTLGEFIPYANFFYAPKAKNPRDETGYYKPTDTGDSAFDFAWLLHQKRNRHHWQWWLLPEDNGGVKVLPIPNRYLLEMLSDWVGAGKAQGHHPPPNDPYAETRKWYHTNKDKMTLHPDTRTTIEMYIQYIPPRN